MTKINGQKCALPKYCNVTIKTQHCYHQNRPNSRNVIEPDMSGINPHFASIMERLQSNVEKRISAPKAICIPSGEE
jgi:hypothetical protein